MPSKRSTSSLSIRSLLALPLAAAFLASCGGGGGATPAAQAAPLLKVGGIRPVAAVLPYAGGTILPNHIGPAVLARQRTDFYAQWKALYVVQGCGAGRYFVKVDADGKAVGGGTARDTITVSEAHGYGMLISVLMADEDSDAHAVFDGMVRYFQDHPASADPSLMAWNQVKGCGNATGDKRGDTSATDGDLDIAYALLLADRKWGSAGAIDYKGLARRVMDAIMRYEVHPAGKHLLVGDWARLDADRTYEYTTRTSDFMLSHLNAFAQNTGDSRWQAVRDRSYQLAALQRDFDAGTGLVPDFINRLDERPAPAPANFFEGDNDGNYSWNAARYPWRVALDALLYGDGRARTLLAPLNDWARGATGNDPSRFAAGYTLKGKAASDETNELAFVSALGVSAMLDPQHQAWLNAIWDDMQKQTLKDNDYYNNTLKMLGMITVSGRWAKP